MDSFIKKIRIPIETALFLRRAHKVAEDKRKKKSKEKCRNFRKQWRKSL